MGYESPLRNQHDLWVAKQTELFADRVSRSDRQVSDSGPQSAQFELAYIPYGPDGVPEERCCEIVESFPCKGFFEGKLAYAGSVYDEDHPENCWCGC